MTSLEDLLMQDNQNIKIIQEIKISQEMHTSVEATAIHELIQKEVKIFTPDDSNYKLLFSTCLIYNHTELLKQILFKYNINLNEILHNNTKSMLPLMCAITRCLTLDEYSKVNTNLNSNINTALKKTKYYDTVNLLLQKNANLNINIITNLNNIFNLTPLLNIAILHCKYDIPCLMLNYDANPNCYESIKINKLNKCKLAIIVAIENFQTFVIEALIRHGAFYNLNVIKYAELQLEAYLDKNTRKHTDTSNSNYRKYCVAMKMLDVLNNYYIKDSINLKNLSKLFLLDNKGEGEYMNEFIGF
jgi:hypothetical protein